MRIAFAGTPEFARVNLSALHAAGHNIVAVLTQPDKASGRGLVMQPSPVKEEAQRLGLELIQPRSLKPGGLGAQEAIERLMQLTPDVMVVVAYGLLLPKSVLDIPKQGCVNIHASLLPRWRGAAPIQRALEAGDQETGVAVMQMEEGLDTGPVWLSRRTPIHPDDNFQTLHDRLAVLGAQAIVDFFSTWSSSAPTAMTATPQPADGITYAHKIAKPDTWIRWNGSAQEVLNQIRALSPQPGASSQLGSQTIKIYEASLIARSPGQARPGEILQADASVLQVACRQGAIALRTLQKPGGRRLGYREFLNGQPMQVGDVFQSEVFPDTPGMPPSKP